MTREELERLIAEVQHRQSELNDVEVKSARAGTPKRLYEALSAFANRTGGGVILFGLDESADFGVVGVGNAHQLQADIGDLASSEMEPAIAAGIHRRRHRRQDGRGGRDRRYPDSPTPVLLQDGRLAEGVVHPGRQHQPADDRLRDLRLRQRPDAADFRRGAGRRGDDGRPGRGPARRLPGAVAPDAAEGRLPSRAAREGDFPPADRSGRGRHVAADVGRPADLRQVPAAVPAPVGHHVSPVLRDHRDREDAAGRAVPRQSEVRGADSRDGDRDRQPRAWRASARAA